MWNPAHAYKNPAAIPVQTVTARWGSQPDPDSGWKGYEPDWHVLTIRETSDRTYPLFVEGWLPSTKADGLAGEPFCWRVADLSCARYDLSEAVYVPAA